MCLDLVYEMKPPQAGVFYKLYGRPDFYKKTTPWDNLMYVSSIHGLGVFQRGRWLKAQDPGHILGSSFGGLYPYGFHGFTNPKSDYITVWYRGAHTTGQQYGQEVIVANEIYICRWGVLGLIDRLKMKYDKSWMGL